MGPYDFHDHGIADKLTNTNNYWRGLSVELLTDERQTLTDLNTQRLSIMYFSGDVFGQNQSSFVYPSGENYLRLRFVPQWGN